MLIRIIKSINALTVANQFNIYKQRTQNRQMGSNWKRNSQSTEMRKWSKFNINEFSAYFQQKLVQFDQQTKQIILQLNTESPNNNQINNKIEDYLKVKQNSNFAISSPLSKIYLLVALEMRSNFSNYQLEKLRRLIIEHILRHPTQNLPLQQKSLQILVRNLCRFGSKIEEKYKLNVITYQIMNALHTNFHNISYQFLPFIVSFINSNLKSSSLNSHKYLLFVDLLQVKLNNVFVDMLKQQNLKQQYRFIFQTDIVKELHQIYSIYGMSSQYAQNLKTFLIAKYFATKLSNPSQAIITFNIIYRCFPHHQNNTNYKLEILKYITSLYTSNHQMQFEIAKESHYLCYSILTHFFHSYFCSLIFHSEDGFTYLPSSTIIKPPQLPQIFWVLYNFKYSIINNSPILNYTIKTCYPDKYIKSSEQVQFIKPTVDTQMNIRVGQSLNKLNLKFTTQQFIAGRFIDFYLYQKRVVIEVDGVVHYNPRTLTTNDSTNYRNIHLMLSGYKLMTISIYEYNICRQIQDLSYLISSKLALLQQKALFVL